MFWLRVAGRLSTQKMTDRYMLFYLCANERLNSDLYFFRGLKIISFTIQDQCNSIGKVLFQIYNQAGRNISIFIQKLMT